MGKSSRRQDCFGEYSRSLAWWAFQTLIPELLILTLFQIHSANVPSWLLGSMVAHGVSFPIHCPRGSIGAGRFKFQCRCFQGCALLGEKAIMHLQILSWYLEKCENITQYSILQECERGTSSYLSVKHCPHEGLQTSFHLCHLLLQPFLFYTLGLSLPWYWSKFGLPFSPSCLLVCISTLNCLHHVCIHPYLSVNLLFVHLVQ